MKNLIKTISLGLLVFGLINCGKKGGNSSPAPAPQITADASQIQIDNKGSKITWSGSTNNIFIQTSAICVKGLASNADDKSIQDHVGELTELINSSSVGKGTLQTAGSNSIYLIVSYNSGTSRTFNLRNDSASLSEDTLSNGSKIIDFFDNVNSEILQKGIISCNNGKK